MANLFENILSWNLWNQAFDFFRGTNPEDPTTSGLYKTIQWWANLYTWLSQELKTWWQQDFEIKKQKARQFLQSKWYDSATIENSLSQIEYKPSYMQRVKEGLWTRMEEVGRTTENLSNQPLSKRLWAGTLAYWWDVVSTAFEPVTSAISPYAQKWLEYTWLDKPLAKGVQEWEEIRQKYPTFADTVEWAFNVSQIFAPKAWVKTGKVIKTGAEMVKKPIVATGKQLTKVPWTVWNILTTWAEYTTSLWTGLSRKTQQVIKQNPELYKKARLWDITAEGELWKFKEALDQRLTDLSETWKGYEIIKKWLKVSNADEVSNIYINTTKDTPFTELTKADKLVLKDASDYFSQIKWDVTDSQLIALRQQLDSIKYDPTTWLERKISPKASAIIGDMRSQVDKLAKERVAWLKELDMKYAPEVWMLKNLKKEIYDWQGNIKPWALWKISNITGKNKEMTLEKFEKVYPELWAKIRALKAFEEVQSIGEIKTWSIARQWAWIALWTAVMPWVWTFAWWFASNPYVVARLLETYGVAKGKIQEILKSKKLSKDNASIVQKAVKETPKEEVEKIITNLSYDPKTNRLTSGNIGPKKLVPKK